MKKIELNNLNHRECARYLGYGTQVPDERIASMMDECEQEICRVSVPRYVYRVFGIEQIEADRVTFRDTEYFLSGQSIVNHLAHCTKAVLLCATLSEAVDRLIRKTQIMDMAKAVVMDAMAGVAVEKLCDAVEEEIREECLENFGQVFFTWRFGFGYGDLPLGEERGALKLLDAGKLVGVNINDSNIMFPRKSVACVIGVSEEKIGKGQRGCVSCNMKERCKYRQRGEHCGF